MLSRPHYFRTLLSRLAHRASFYRTAVFFEQLEGTAGSIEKEKSINAFRGGLEGELGEFDALMGHINDKVKIGVTTKVVHNYYLKKYVNPSQHAALLPELAEGGLAAKMCVKDEESELTLYDVNIFLKYIAAVSGTGSQTEKSQKIIDVVEQVSRKEGVCFLRLIDHKITIGARGKTFKNAKISKAKAEKQE
jgi:hypothetical protein